MTTFFILILIAVAFLLLAIANLDEFGTRYETLAITSCPEHSDKESRAYSFQFPTAVKHPDSTVRG